MYSHQVASEMIFVIDQILQLPDETIRQSNSSSTYVI